MQIKPKILQDWQTQRLISAKLAQTLAQDLEHKARAKAARNWTIALVTLGALALGIAGILFISANWHEITRLTKVSLALITTFGSLFLGFYLAFYQKNLPQLGRALIFLSTLLFGGTLALVSQIYHLDGEPSGLFLLWTAGILPLAYLLQERNILRLSLLTLFLTIILFLGNAQSLGPTEIARSFENLGLMVLTGLSFFALGSLQKIFPQTQNFGTLWRLWGLKIAIFFLFFLTFGTILKEVSEQIFTNFQLVPTLILLGLSAGFFLFTLYRNPPRKIPQKIAAGLFGANLVILGLYFLLPKILNPALNFADTALFSLMLILFNLVLIANLAGLLFLGYQQENLKILNLAFLGIGVFIFGKYLQFFEDLLEGSAFFLVGGILLLLIGYFLEKKRRDLTQKITP